MLLKGPHVYSTPVCCPLDAYAYVSTDSQYQTISLSNYCSPRQALGKGTVTPQKKVRQLKLALTLSDHPRNLSSTSSYNHTTSPTLWLKVKLNLQSP
jgi:hypothetical protein